MENGQLLTSIAELIRNNTTIVNKQDKTDNNLTTIDKTISGAINEINNKETTNETNINSHISNISNPHNTNLSQLKDIAITNPTDKQVISYDTATSKFINRDCCDEKVKMTSISTESKYLGEWIDGITIQNVGNNLICKSLDGQEISLLEMNRLSGLDKNIMDYLNAISNPMTVRAVVNTYADLSIITSPVNGNVAIVKADENNSNKQWTYIYVDSTWNPLTENNVTVRDFFVDKLDLASEAKGKLAQVNMDMTDIVKTVDLANYLKGTDASSTYATISQVSAKANSSDIYTQTQTDNLLSNKVDKVANKSLVDDTEIAKLQAITGSNTGDETQTTIKDKLKNASTTQDGYLTSVDWNTFNNKQNKIFIQSTQPTIALDNIWVDNNINPYILKVCDGTNYTQVGNSASGSVQEIVIQNTQPGDTTIKLWLDTSSNPILKWYNGTSWINISSSTGGHIIKDETTTYTSRKNLKFTGGITITDDSTNDTTIIDIASSSGGFLNVKNLGMTIADGGDNATISFNNPASDNIDKIYLYVSYLEDLSNQAYDYVSTHATLLKNTFPITNGASNTFSLPITDINRNKSSYIKVFVGYGGTDYSSGASINQVLSDVTPTSPVTNILVTQLTKSSVKLNWTNPTNSDLKNVNVLMKYDTTINDIYDGTIVYTGSSNTCTITGLDEGKQVYFRLYTLDKSDNIQSDISQITNIQLDNTAPNEVTGFSLLSGFSICKLKFADSSSTDWKLTKVIRKVGSEPTSIDDGTLIFTNMTKDSYKNNYFIDGGLSNGTTYFYKIYSIDNFDNISSGVAQVGNPVATALPEVNNFKIENIENGTKQKISWTNSFAPSGLTYVERQLFYTKDQTVALDTMTRDQCIASGLISSLTLGAGTGQGIDDSFTTSTSLTKGDVSRYKIFIHYDSSGTPIWSSGTYDIKEVEDETPLTDVTGLVTTVGDTQNTISWINPNTIMDSDFSKVQIFRKIGTYPDGNNEMEKVYESTNQNAGNLNTFTDTGLTNNTIYYYLIKLIDTSGNINVNTKFTLTPVPLPIYTISFDSSTKTWTRGGLATSMSSADFNSISPYKDIKRVLLTDAKVKTYLKSTDSTMKEDGTSATLDGTQGQCMVEIPKFYYKYEYDGTSIHKWTIANSAIGGCTLHPAFIRNSANKDCLYIGCYKGYVNGTKLESRSGIVPTTSEKSYSDFRTLAETRGVGFTQFDSLSLHILQLLFILQYGNADFSSVLNSGQDLGNVLTTGGTNSLGNSTGIVGNYSSLYGVENLIGETHSVIDGLIAGSKYWQSNNSFGSMTSESTTGTYTQLSSATPSTTNGFIADIEPISSAFIGKNMTGSSSESFYDYQVSKNGSNLNVMLLGGSSLASQRGLFNNEFVDITNMSTTTNMTSEGIIDSTYNVWSYTLDRSNFGIKSLSSYSLVDNTTPQITANLSIQNLSGRLIAY